MATNFAKALYYKGADVCLIKTYDTNDNIPKDIHIIDIKSTYEMFEYVKHSIKVAKKGKLSSATLMDNSKQILIQKKPYFFAISAVSDFIPSFPQDGKIKKQSLGDNWDLKLKKNIDILNSIDKDGIFTIGFKAELDKNDAFSNASNMLKDKNIDGVCLNIIDEKNNFGSDTNNIELFTKNKKEPISYSGDKLKISLQILDSLKDEFDDK
jgi:phosphopantothenoylcysteine decarboxylase/phosphopantothenate--cysteine ligase